MLVLMFTACGGNKSAGETTAGASVSDSTAEATTASTTADNKPVTLRFLWWGSDTRHNNTLAMIDLYQKANPNVTIEPEYGGWDGYQDKLTTQLAGGTAPDLMQLSTTWATDLQKKGGFFADLSKYKQLFDLSMFSSNLIDAYCKMGDAVIAAPAGVSGYAFLVNKDLLGKVGIQPDQKWTWDSYLDAAKKVHSYNKECYLTSSGDKVTIYEKYVMPYIQGLIKNNLVAEDYTLRFSRDNLLAALNFIKTLNDNNAWPPVTEVANNMTLDQDPRWINQKVAVNLDWISGMLPAAQVIKTAADVEIYPTISGDKDTAIFSQPSPSMLLAVNATSGHIEAAVKFLNYMFTDEEALKTLKDCRGTPSSAKGLEVADKEKFVDPLVLKALKLAVDNSTTIPYSAINDDTELKAAAEDVIEMITFNKITPEAAADEIISRMNTRLTEMKAGK
jgi:ABC-type sugar transport system, periplasmic component